MKLHVIVVLGSIAVANLQAQPRDSLVTQDRAGKITLGMTVEELYAAYGKDNVRLVDLYGEGMFTPALQVFVAPDLHRPIAEALINQVCGHFRVTRIIVVGPALRTRDGLGVGSTVADVRRRFPTTQQNREAGPSLLVAAAQMTFALSDDRFADSTRVVRMWTWNASLPDSVSRCRRQ